MRRSTILTFLLISLVLYSGGISRADEPVDLIGSTVDTGESGSTGDSYILETSWQTTDPFGEFDPSLGAAAALNRALGLMFEGHASPEQIEMQRKMVMEHSNGYQETAPFSEDVLKELQDNFSDAFPEEVELEPFDLIPSEVTVVVEDGQTFALVRYDREEYLERLLQRLYFKLIQGPVLLTVPYSSASESIKPEFRNWDNFQYAGTSNTMEWDDIRKVAVDWDSTQTVVLKYEDGLIACYDSGCKYYIDHTAAVACAGAMLAHPDIDQFASVDRLNFVLKSVDD